jgi:hypothetical protein
MHKTGVLVPGQGFVPEKLAIPAVQEKADLRLSKSARGVEAPE